MAGEIKKVQFSEGLNVAAPADVPFTPDDFSGIMPTTKGGTGVNGSATFPTSGTVATTADITAAFEGRKFKDPVLLATTGNITLSGEQTIDGVLTSASRVLVKSQSSTSENGIYVSAAGAWSRASDANTWDELTSAIVSVGRGSTQADTVWLCTSDAGGSLGVDPVAWELRAGTGSVDLSSDVFGVLPVTNGGTGQSSGAAAIKSLSGMNAKGDIITHDASTTAVLGVGANGKVLSADSAEATGLKWVDAATLPINLASQVTGTLPIANGGTGQITANAALNALLPSQASNANKFLKTNGTDTSWASASGGAGEVNAVLNPSGADGLTGYANGTNHVVSQLTSGSPLDPAITTAIRIQASANQAESSTVAASGGYYTISTHPVALRNKKLKVECHINAISSGDTWKVSVYTGTTRMALSTDSSGSTTLPTGVAGKFVTYFDADASTSYRVVFTRAAGSGTTNLELTNLIVGPGIQPQGAVVGDITYGAGLTLNNMPATLVNNWTYQRLGSSLKIQGIIQFAADGVSGSEVSFTLPNSLTTTTTRISLGTCDYYSAGASRVAPLEGEGVSGDLGKIKLFVSAFLAGIIGTECGTSGGRIPNFYVDALIPINEWAGSATVNLAQNDAEYASNSGTWDADDTTSFQWGPDGQTIPASSNLATRRNKRVRFKTPIQATDKLELQLQISGTWLPAQGVRFRTSGHSLDQLRYLNSATNADTAGIGFETLSSPNGTDLDVSFGHYTTAYMVASGTEPSTYTQTEVDWSTAVGSDVVKWRVVKYSGGQAIGFGLADTSGNAGLVNPYSTSGAGVVYAGTYAPSSVGTPTNCTVGTFQQFRYSRVGKVVSVVGVVAVSATASSSCDFFITLPIASNISTYTCSGVVSHAQVGALYATGGVLGDAANDRAQIVWRSNTDTASREMYINFSYELV